MLPQSVRLSGIVMDSDRKPLRDVWINHTGVRIENLKTYPQGRFDVETRAPAIVFRKSGFQSTYWRVHEDRNLAITLVGPAPRIKECGGFSNCVALKGFGSFSTFCLPKVPGVKISKQGNDIDYGRRLFWVGTDSGKAAIQHAAGGMWGSGLPEDEDLWSARQYTEISYIDREGFGIIDARGKSIDGRCWRVLGHAFETASYRNVPEQEGVCWTVCSMACASRYGGPNLRRVDKKS